MKRAELALRLVATVLASSLFGPVQAADCLALGAPTGGGAGDEIVAIVQEAAKRAGLCLHITRAPANRLPTLPLDGEILTDSAPPGIDGEILLPTPVATFEGALYWPQNQDQPAGPKAQIGVILGQDWALRAVEARGAHPYEVRDNRQLLKMMAAGRIDGMMLPSISFRHFLPRYPLLGTSQSVRVASLPVRVLLKKSQQDAATPLDTALAGVVRDGTAEAILQRYAPR